MPGAETPTGVHTEAVIGHQIGEIEETEGIGPGDRTMTLNVRSPDHFASNITRRKDTVIGARLQILSRVSMVFERHTPSVHVLE